MPRVPAVPVVRTGSHGFPRGPTGCLLDTDIVGSCGCLLLPQVPVGCQRCCGVPWIAQGPVGIPIFHRVFWSSKGAPWSHGVSRSPMGYSLILQIAQGPTGIHGSYGVFRSRTRALWSHKVCRSPMGCLLTPWVMRGLMGCLLTLWIAQRPTYICGSYGVFRSPMVALWCHMVSSDFSGCLLVPCAVCGPLGCLLTPRTAQGITGICEARGMSRSALGAPWSHRVSSDPMGCLLAPQIPRCPAGHPQCPLVP